MSASPADGPDRDASSSCEARDGGGSHQPNDSAAPFDVDRIEPATGDNLLLGSAEGVREWEDELKREIQRLRAEVSGLRQSKSDLLARLRDVERSLSLDEEEALKSKGAASGGAQGKRLHSKSEVALGRTGPSVRTMDRTLAAVAALVLGIVLGLAGGAFFGTGPDRDPAQVAAASGDRGGDSDSTGHDSSEFSQPHDGGVSLNPGGVRVPEPSDLARKDLPIETPGSLKGRPIDASVSVLSGAVEGSKAAEPSGGSRPLGATENVKRRNTEGSSEPGAAWELPVHLADLSPVAFQIRYGASDHPCAFAEALMDPARRPELLAALGPCIGAHGEDGSPVGTHRVAGVDCCAHHAFVERMTRASRDKDALDGLLAEARVAQEDGQIPPLLRMRAERSALQFLRRLAGTWASAGIDDGSSDHRWTSSSSDPTRMRMASWIRLEETGEAHSFEMAIELSDGPRGDLLVAFDWLGTDPLGVAFK